MNRIDEDFRGKSVSIPKFMNEEQTNRRTVNNNSRSYIERNTTERNGYISDDSPYTEKNSQMDSPRKASGGRSNNPPKNKNRRKKKKAVRRVLFSFLVLAAIVTGHLIARVQVQVTAALNTLDRSGGIDLSNVKVKNNNLGTDDRIINVLLVGADKREKWKQAGRSDSVMIATLDMKNKRLKITSLMRDMYVAIPGYNKTKFNAAYSYGGVELLYQTIADNFGMKLDGYVVVDFAAFKKVIKTLGGVKIELTQAEYQYLTTAYHRGTVLDLKEGINDMDGDQALAYTRIRQDAKGDFGRTERQRKVLQSIFNEVKSMSFSEDVKLAKEILPYVQTDLTNKEIISYLTSILTMGTTQIDQMRIPVDNSYTQDRINKQAVLIPELDVNTRALHDFIYDYKGE